MVRRPAALAMALALAAAAAVPSRGGDLPDENCVRILRDARIAAIAGDREKAKTLVQRAVEEYPKEALPAVALVQLARTGSPAEAKDARERLQARLFASDAALPIAAIRYLAEDPLATREDTILLRDAVRHGLEKAPSDPKLLETAYRLAVRNGDSADALAIVDRQLAASATPDLLRRKLAVLANLSRWSEAEPIARELVASNPKRYPERQALIDALVGQGKLDAARAEIDAAIAAMALTAPNDWVSFRLLLPLGWAFRDAGRDAESRQTFQRALDFSAENTEARDVLLRVLVSPQERAEKEAAADQRWQGEKEPIRLFEEGTKRLAAGDATSAFEMLQRAVHAYPTDDVWRRPRFASRSSSSPIGRRPSSSLAGSSTRRIDAIAPSSLFVARSPWIRHRTRPTSTCTSAWGSSATPPVLRPRRRSTRRGRRRPPERESEALHVHLERGLQRLVVETVDVADEVVGREPLDGGEDEPREFVLGPAGLAVAKEMDQQPRLSVVDRVLAAVELRGRRAPELGEG